jgi:hypothetical protein
LDDVDQLAQEIVVPELVEGHHGGSVWEFSEEGALAGHDVVVRCQELKCLEQNAVLSCREEQTGVLALEVEQSDIWYIPDLVSGRSIAEPLGPSLRGQ